MRDIKSNSPGEDIDVFARQAPPPVDVPLHEPMTKRMNIDLIVNKNSQVWLAHDMPFPGILQWAEYDVDMATVTFVTTDGRMQDTGLKVQPVMRRYLRQATVIDAVLVQEGKIHDFFRVPLIVRESMD
jgi:hypothetical protein